MSNTVSTRNPVSFPRSTSAQPVPSESTQPTSTYLAPDDPFPGSLVELDLDQLHVLHSRVCRQIDLEYITDPEGPHPITLDRADELTAELNEREQDFAQYPPASLYGGAFTTAQFLDDRLPETSEPQPQRDLTWARDLFTRRNRKLGDEVLEIRDLRTVSPGDRLEGWNGDRLQWVGAVEQVAPSLDVCWVLEGLNQDRRLVHRGDTDLYYHLPFCAVAPRP